MEDVPSLADLAKAHNQRIGETALCLACKGQFVFDVESGGLCGACNESNDDRL